MERSAIVSKRVQEGWARDPQMGKGPAYGRDQVMVPAEARKVFQEL
jgi:hypothetical protein